ncbi:hypothetical protein [Rhizobium sp. PL01]|uniref:hypothetical protein n=1 Tax=Rhizobium sp. PL01 TaxID=3085631 RepID=UPI002982064A|nr:hypothetical protein [Rhizobium sp. PL01]MDW5318277.1 hypothetical protein [Rhizobium sp. PL01]
MSLRRQQGQNDGSIEDVKPDELAIARSTETPVKKNFNLADQPTREHPQPIVQSEPVSAEPEPLAETGSDIQGTRESDSEEGAETSGPASSDIGTTLAYSVARVEPMAKAAPAKRRGRAKKIDAVAIVSQTAPFVPTISDEMSLDQEIRVLRGQLASKLRLQNAQLKQMLERFER